MEQSPRAHRREITIEWGDCDPAGIVYYPRYFEMFDASTAHMISSASGMKKAALLARHGAVGFPMVKTDAEFHRPSSYGDEVVIETTVAHVGRSSFQILHRLLNGGVLAIEAHETRVWTARDASGAIRAAPLPDELVAALKA
jgi:4-hydroxybenzoyl-CoA thioesterase